MYSADVKFERLVKLKCTSPTLGRYTFKLMLSPVLCTIDECIGWLMFITLPDTGIRSMIVYKIYWGWLKF